MRTVGTVVIAISALAFAAGGVAGERTWRGVSSSEAMCVSCHHAGDPTRKGEPPHSTDFSSSCHLCHVVPVKAYLQTSAALLGVSPPSFVEGLRDPVVADQSCLECHLARGRGHILCEGCHSAGETAVDLTQGCTGCHDAHGTLPPHDGVECRQCHVDAMVGHEDKVKATMHRRLSGLRPGRVDDSESARIVLERGQ